MNDVPEALELLSTRVDELEKRVHALEQTAEGSAPAIQASSAVAQPLDSADTQGEQDGGMFPLLGRAMLGIAGAYALRAIAESSSLPKVAIAGVAIVYAAAWLLWAAKATGASFRVRVVYAGTSALILAPMLWELCLHFKVLSPTATAFVLVVYGITATIFTRKDDASPIAWIAHGTAGLTAFALSIGTHVMMPFVVALLLLVLLGEYANLKGRKVPIRAVEFLITDVVICALIFVYSGPQNARPDYPALGVVALLAPGILLFLINGASVVIKTVFMQKTITIFEAVQTMIAFVLAASSLILFVPQSGVRIFAVVCLALSAASYVISFTYFRPSAEQRNFRVFGSWSVLLLLAGLVWSLPLSWSPAALGMIALSAIVLGVRTKCMMLELHGLVFLVVAAMISRSPEYAYRELAGSSPVKPDLSIFLVSAFALLCYAAGKERAGEAWKQQVLHVIPALLAAFALAALLVHGLLALSARVIPLDVFHLAFARTLTICVVAMAFAFGGARWNRLEMKRIAYGALALMAAKIALEDLRHGRMEFIAGSIFLFAVTLMAVPRLARIAPKIRSVMGADITLPKKV